VNIWQSYKQEGGYHLHFVRLTTTLLEDEGPPYIYSLHWLEIRGCKESFHFYIYVSFSRFLKTFYHANA